MKKKVVIVVGEQEISLQQCQLIIKGEERVETVPIEELNFLLIENPRIQINGHILNLLSSLGIIIVVCDDCHMPSSIVFPIEGNCKQSSILRYQILADEQLKNDIWNQIVYQKILNQKDVLKFAGYETDIYNEKQASTVYFSCLFGAEFKRNRRKTGINSMLNYGYSVLRALVAKQVVSSGMYFGVGINQHSPSDSFPLVDDLIEPFRPIIDRTVYLMVIKGKSEVDAEVRKNIIKTIDETVYINDVEHTLQDAISLYVSSCVNVLMHRRKKLFCLCMH